MIFKVIPHEDHLKEFRQLLPEVHAYSNQDVVEHFQESCELLECVTIVRTWSMPPEHVQTFAEMTPLFFHVDKNGLNLSSVTQLTVAGELLIGSIKMISNPNGCWDFFDGKISWLVCLIFLKGV